MSAEAAAVARRAAENAERDGITKGTLNLPFQPGRPHCLWGHLYTAAREADPNIRLDQIDAVFHPVLCEVAPPNTSIPIDLWPGSQHNDAPDTDERDVAKVLLQVADRLDVS